MSSRSPARIGLVWAMTLLVAMSPGGGASADDSPAAAPAAAPATAPTPDEALQTLRDGNERFARGQAEHPRQDTARAAETALDGQHPIATVLSCSDSRVPVEILFDCGIGDAFTVRVAGNVADVDEIGSIEYGVDHLETPVLVVLGHSKCGAVTAVVTGAELHGLIPPLVENIRPAVEAARQNFPGREGADLVPEAIRANVWQTIDDICHNSPAVRNRLATGKLTIVGAVYDLESGRVDWLGPHPEQGRLLRYSDNGPLGHAAHGGRGRAAPAGGSHDGAAEQSAEEHVATDDAHAETGAHAAAPAGSGGSGVGFWLAVVGIGLANIGLGFAVKHLLPAFRR